MSIIITGAAGYIGSVLFKKLISKGHHPIMVDRGYFGYDSVDFENQIWYHSVDQFIENHKLTAEDTIFHLSGLSNDPMADYDPTANVMQNTVATKRLAEYAAKVGCKFIFASSASVYGFTDEGEVDETSKINPQSNYAKSKLQAEIELDCAANFDFAPIAVRNGTVMGLSPRMRFDLVVNALVRYAYEYSEINLFAGGETWRPLVNVADVADCYIWLMENYEKASIAGQLEIYNLVHKNYRVSELGLWMTQKCFKTVTSKEIKLRCDYDTMEVRSYRMSSNKLRRLGFEANIGILQSVQEIWAWIEKNNINLHDPIYYNINWLKNCERVCNVLGKNFDLLESV